MGENTKIEWSDATWNPVRGCTRVSPGCGGPGPHGGCYAEGIAARFSKPGQAFEGFAEMQGGKPRWTGKLALVESALLLPLRWRKPRRIFVNSMSDLFHENLPDEAIDKVFAVMALCPQHTFQVLTKRSTRMREYVERKRRAAPEWVHLPSLGGRVLLPYEGGWPTYIWLGVSAEDQQRADERIPDLVATPAAIRFVSYEPALGPLNLHSALCRQTGSCPTCPACLATLDLVIAGGESGPKARAASRQWFRSVREQCARAGIAYFHKQNGEFVDADEWLDAFGPANLLESDFQTPWSPPRPLNFHHATHLAKALKVPFEHHSDGSTSLRVGKPRAGRLLDGREHNAIPEAL